MGQKRFTLWLVFFVILNSKISFAQNNHSKTLSSSDIEYFINKSEELSLYQKDYWKILLHYHGNSSAIQSDNFFLDKNGDKNPKAELQETIRGFFKTDIALDNDHPICRFPARLKWISKELQIPSNILPKVNCAEFKTYLKNTSAYEIDIAFASENVNNLMSMMGHIFLKIVGKKDGVKVNNALGYFANYSSTRTIPFIFGALFSGAPGVYMMEPYQNKIYEYNDGQKRSIWEYKLNLTQDQINILMLHIWEMKRVNAKYNFINHNCGNALLYLLYIADPNLQKIYSLYDTPLDIIKNLDRNNYITNIEILPADNYKFRMISNNFSSQDKKVIKDFLNNGDIESFDQYQSLQKKSNVLYGTGTVLNYQLTNGNISQESYDLLRNKIDKLSSSLPKNNLTYKIKNPLKKSDSSRVVLGYKAQGLNRNVVNFGFYPVYNNINGNNSEYFNEFELQIMNFEGGYYTKQNKVKLDNLDIIKIKSIIPYDSLISGLSSSFKANIERERFDSQTNKMFPNTSFGVGLGKQLFDNNIMLYSMLNFGYSYFQNNNLAYTNPEIGAIFREGKYGKLNAKYTKYYSTNSYKYQNLLAIDQTFFLIENHDIVLSYKINDSDLEKDFRSIGLEYQYHF